jgi:uncharacterized protein with HEPN domain
MARDLQLFLDDILATIAVVETALAGKSRHDFDSDVILHLGIQRAIEIISEASKHIPEHLLEKAPEIPWRSIRGMGNILRHQYHRIADDVIWDVITHDLPPLKAAILALKNDLNEKA